MKRYIFALALLSGALALSQHVNAATQSVTANIAFDSAITLTKNADINFGVVKAGAAANYTITTAAVVSTGGAGEVLGGTPAAGNITVAGSATQTVAVSVGSYTANNGVTPSAATCSYNGEAAAACSLTAQAAPGAGKTLLLGVTVAVDGTQAAASTAAPTFVVTVVYG